MPRLSEETTRIIKEKIESEARALFVSKGFSATATREIAQAVGLTAGALYNYYPSKESLFATVVERYRARFSADDNPVRQLICQKRFPFDLPELALAIRDLVDEHRDYWLLWYVDVLEFDGAHFQSALAPAALLGLNELGEHLDDLRERGTLRVDPKLAFVMAYMHLFNYFLVETLFRGKNHYGVSDDEAIRVMADVFLHGILSPAAERP